MEEHKFLDEYYTNRNNEDRRLTSRHGSVEFLTTMRYIDKYLRSGDRVIEIGAASGRYSHALARRGYAVDAVELVERNIEVFRENTLLGEQITITQGDARNLAGFADGIYDVTLLLGPLYHLYTREDKARAIGEALRVTKRGGVVFAAYVISDGAVLDDSFKRKYFSIAESMKNGFVDPETFAVSSEPSLIFELVRKEYIDDLMGDFAVTRLHYAASDGYAEHMREAVDAMSDEEFEFYLRYHFATCERSDMVGMSHHSLDIFTKD